MDQRNFIFYYLLIRIRHPPSDIYRMIRVLDIPFKARNLDLKDGSNRLDLLWNPL